MRIVHIITRLIIGGAQENTVVTVLGLRQMPGVSVAIVAGPTSGPEGSLVDLVRDKPGLFTCVPTLVRPVHPWKDALALRALVRWLRSDRPDLVHTHSGKAGFLGRLAARQARVPVIVHTVHGPSFGQFQGLFANTLFRAAERLAGSMTDHFVVVADAMRRQYLAASIGHADQYTRIFSGFALEPYAQARNDSALRRRLGLSPNDLVVGKIARLFKLKGHDELLAIGPTLFRSCPNLKLLFVGDGVLKAKLEQSFAAAGYGSRVLFAGLVQPEDVPRYVGIMDVVVHLSRREGLPRALPQAMAASKPVVAYDCDGAGEVCLNGRTGYLVPSGDRDCLSQRLLELANDPSLRARLGKEGQGFAKRHFAADRMVEDLYRLYGRLLEGAGGRRKTDT